MELTFLQQSQAFVYSLLLGVLAGVFYGVLKIIRIAFCTGKLSVFLLDFFFMLVTFISIYIFSVAYLLGYVRVFAIFGTFFAFILYRATAGRLFSKLYYPIIGFVKAILCKISANFKKIIKKLLKIIHKILYNAINSISVFKRQKLKRKTNKDSLNNDKISEKKIKKTAPISGSIAGEKKRYKRD